MLEPFIYPVSGVLKLWHILMHSVFGMDDSTAWVVSIFGLVLTVRLLLIPAFWTQAKSVRTGVAMRPEQAALAEEYATRTDRESVAEFERKSKELRERYNYSIAAGCIPTLIQIPVFLGLYQVLLRMARPSSGSTDIAPDARIGFLNSEEIRTFLGASINGIPLPAYISMPAEALARLGTTREEVRDFLLPVIIAVVIFTVGNMLAALMRNAKTLDWDSKAARGSSRFLVIMTLFIPVLLITLAFTAPLPVAIILYWFANNLWTLVQSLILYPLVNRRIPLHESFEEFSRERREAARAEDREKRRIRWDVRRRKALGALQPWKIPGIRRELVAEKTARKEAATAEKAEQKAIRKAKRAASSALHKERLARRREERTARKQVRSNNPPAEPTASDAPDPARSAED
ncbi:membrane protein insertase YidC [Corynebacterium hylobatis]|uniref:membrane protein insertase YidC n=1 Tax=Corynebacterium hylobatis TaxID=1859290 RepID=UPI0013E03820|nr:membrane protein insertase YidC [Corynebacterium hylobatis]